jgi:hypothetical protein
MTPAEVAAEVAEVIRWTSYGRESRATAKGLAAAVLGGLRRHYFDRDLPVTVIWQGPPILVDHEAEARVAVTVTTAPAGRADVLRRLLEHRAASNAIDAQLVVFTGGAGVGLPAMLGGLPLYALPLVGR